MRNDTVTLTSRVLWIAISIAVVSLLCEAGFVLIMKGFNAAFQFSGAYSVVLFSAFCGIIPFWPTPSKLSDLQLDFRRRALIFAEVSAVVVAALFVFMLTQKGHTHETSLIGLLSYLTVALIFFPGGGKARKEVECRPGLRCPRQPRQQAGRPTPSTRAIACEASRPGKPTATTPMAGVPAPTAPTG